MTSYAIILTHNRPEMLTECVRAIAAQVDRVEITDNASDPPVRKYPVAWPGNVEILSNPTQPPNLARMWNAAFERIEKRERYFGHETWDIAVLCDDVTVPAGWFETARGGMRAQHAAAGSTHSGSGLVVKTEPDNDIWNRMPGHAFVVAGEARLRAAETMQWWWCDSDMDWEARKAGGMTLTPGPVAYNSHPNFWTNAKPELGAQAGLDRQAFVEKWGWAPW